jgi:predicted acyltransferase
MRSEPRRQRLILLGILLLVLLSYPIITAVSKPILIMGMPLLFLYIFSVWVTVVVVLYRSAHKKHTGKDE